MSEEPVPGAVAITAGSQVNGALVGRFTPEQVLSGTVVVGLGLSLSLFATTIADGPLWLVVTLLVLTLGTAGFVLPSAPAIALASNPHRAGSAAALLGALQFGLGALIAPLTSIGGTPTAESMAGVMAGTIVISALLLLAVRRSWNRVPTTSTIDADDASTDSRVPVPAGVAAASVRADGTQSDVHAPGFGRPSATRASDHARTAGPATRADEPDAVPCPG